MPATCGCRMFQYAASVASARAGSSSALGVVSFRPQAWPLPRDRSHDRTRATAAMHAGMGRRRVSRSGGRNWLHLHGSSEDELAEQPNAQAEVEGPASSKPTGSQWRWRIVLPLIIAALFIIVGLTFWANLLMRPSIEAGYTRTNAAYVSQKTVDQWWAPALDVEVRFYVHNHSRVTAFIHPNNRTLPSTRKPIPIIYRTSDPSEAFYAGPGGDANLTNLSSTGLTLSNAEDVEFGTGWIVVGLLALTPAVIWRRRIAARVAALAARQPGQGPTVHFRWQQEPGKPATVVVTDPTGSPEYSWHVLPRKMHAVTNDVGEDAELSGDLGPHRWIVLRSGDELVVPTSRAEPIIGTHAPPPQLLPGQESKLVPAHRALLSAYAAVLGQTLLLPGLIRPPTELDNKYNTFKTFEMLYRTLLCWRWSVRLQVESHIRRQLRHLSDSYVRAQMLISETSHDADEQRRRLNKLREECQQLNTSLSDIPHRAAPLIIGLATLLPVVPAIVKTHQIQFRTFLVIILVLTLITLLFLPGVFAMIAYTDAFRCKRKLFISYTIPGTPIAQRTGENVYKLENAVFTLLHQPKRLERASDFWAPVVVLTAWVVFVPIYALHLLAGPYPIGLLSLAFSVILIAIGAILVTLWIVENFLCRPRDER